MDFVVMFCFAVAVMMHPLPEGWLHTSETDMKHFVNPNFSVVVESLVFYGLCRTSIHLVLSATLP